MELVVLNCLMTDFCFVCIHKPILRHVCKFSSCHVICLICHNCGQVKDMTKELDTLLSLIEQEGGFKDACTVLHQNSILTLEDGLKNLFQTFRMCRVSIYTLFGRTYIVIMFFILPSGVVTHMLKRFSSQCFREKWRKNLWRFKSFKGRCLKVCNFIFAVV